MTSGAISLASLLPSSEDATQLSFFDRVTELWLGLGFYTRAALIGLGVLLVLTAIVFGLRWLGRSGRRSLLIGFTVVSGIDAIALGVWAMLLPEPKGSYFVLWHQLVRVGAALGLTGFSLGFMGSTLPQLMNRLEGRGFIPFVASRHVRAHKSGFLTVISFLSIAGVAVSSFALCAVVSIMGGFGADLKRKILGNNAHVRILATKPGGFEYWREVLDEARVTPGVAAATPVVSGEAMASSNSNTAGVILRGIDTETIGNVIELVDNIEVGKLEYVDDPVKLARLPPDEPIGIGPGGEIYLKGPDIKPFLDDKVDPDVEAAVVPEDAYPGIILGRELAKSMHVYVGEEITLVSPLGDLGPMGVLPRSRRFRVAAIFYSGMYEYDSSHAYVKLDTAQEFLEMGHRVSAVEVKVDNAEAVTGVSNRLRQQIERKDLKVRDWKELNQKLFSALMLEKIATFIILSIAIAVASFCIICTLLLMVTEKSKEIAILKALGSSDGSIMRIFMTEGVMIGGIGTIFGVVTGFVMMASLKILDVRLDPEVYYVDRLPISVDWVEYLLVAVAALAITTLATIYPARAASRLRPVDGIRYE